jgi:superfamily I DNA/RNA helicase
MLPQGNLVDLISFLIALDAFRTLRGDEDPHSKDALTLLRRHQGDVAESIEGYFAPIVSSGKYVRFKAQITAAARPTLGLSQAAIQAEALRELMAAMRSDLDTIGSIFVEDRITTAARKIAVAAASESPESILNGLSTLPSVSRLTIPRKWIVEAAALANVAPTEIENTLVDAATAKNLGSELRDIESRLLGADPQSAEAADLQEQKQRVLARIESVAKSSNDRAVVLATAASQATQSQAYVSKVGKEQGLSPDQEKAMLIRGKGMIAAGAGSGKTKVLASKVVYHTKEVGLPIASVMATSFSKKSAAELRERIERYAGSSIPKNAETGFGTTHSIARQLMIDFGGTFRTKMKGYEETTLVLLAMKQVELSSPKAAFGPVPEVDLFDGRVAPTNSTNITFSQALDAALASRNLKNLPNFFRGLIQNFRNPNDEYYPYNQRATKNFTDPRGLADKPYKYTMQAFDMLGVKYSPNTDPNLVTKTAAKKRRDVDSKYSSAKNPVNQWFNLDLKLTDTGGEDGKPLPPGHFKRAITQFKGRLVSPTQAWNKDQSPEAAVYAAYEFLRGPSGEVDFIGKGDFDDLLIDASRMMLSNPKALKSIQERFKVVLVDEAQDLNRSQHLMFGLIAGYVDPMKARNVGKVDKFSEIAKDDGGITADTYCFIGDDKQAIYSFRGADPDTFIEMSDMVKGGAGFKTQLLKTNYRSGQEIVTAANKLIANNEKQVPMVCEANPKRTNNGAVRVQKFNMSDGMDFSEAAQWMATEIEDRMKNDNPHKGYDSFGVGLRTNAEAYQYTIALLKKGIPFRSKANFFKDPTAKALISWLTIANEGLSGNADKVNEAILNARSAPVSFLGDKFVQELQQRASGNYLTWLASNSRGFYPPGKMSENLQMFVGNLMAVAKMDTNNPERLLKDLLELKGANGSSMLSVMVDKIEDDEEVMADLQAENGGNVPDEDMVLQRALLPLDPLTEMLGSRANLAEGMKYIQDLQRANAKLSKDDDPDAPDFKVPAVTIGTVHSWKGLEVEQMFVPTVGGQFPNLRSPIEDERRLMYVALTRGENQVTILDIPVMKVGKDGKSRIQASQFVGELCLGPTKTASTKFASTLPDGRSFFDPEVMDAYSRGEDLFSESPSLSSSWGTTLLGDE